jgi:hypothetical protein
MKVNQKPNGELFISCDEEEDSKTIFEASTEEECNNYIDFLGYTGTIWNNCKKETNDNAQEVVCDTRK